MKLNRNHIRKIIAEEIKRINEIVAGDMPGSRDPIDISTPPYIPYPSPGETGTQPEMPKLSVQEVIEAMEAAIRNSGATGQVCLDAAMVERVVQTLTGLNPFR